MPRRKTTPAASFSVASHHLISDAATPPCSDARRGIGSPKPGVEFEKLAHPEFLDFRRSELPDAVPRHPHRPLPGKLDVRPAHVPAPRDRVPRLRVNALISQ